MPYVVMRVAATLAIVAGLVIGTSTLGSAAEDDHLRVLAVGERSPAGVTAVVAAPYQLSGRELSSSDFEATVGAADRPLHVEDVAAKDLDLVIVLDNSAQVSQLILLEQLGAVAQLLVDLKGDARVALYTTTSSSPLQGFTTNRQALLSALRRLRPGGQSELAPALGAALRDLRAGPKIQHVVLGFSGGGVEASPPPTADRVANQLVGAGLQLHWVLLNGQVPAVAQELATLSGRPVVRAVGSPLALLDHVVAELRSEYRVTVDTGSLTGAVRIRLSASTPPQDVVIPVAAAAPLPGAKPTGPSPPPSIAGQPRAAAPAPLAVPGVVAGGSRRRWPSGGTAIGLALILVGATVLILGRSGSHRKAHTGAAAAAAAGPATVAHHDPPTSRARAAGPATAPDRAPSRTCPWPPPTVSAPPQWAAPHRPVRSPWPPPDSRAAARR